MKNVHYVRTQKEFENAIKTLNRQRLWAFDTETNTLDPKVGEVLLIQIGDYNDQFVFDCYKLKNSINSLLTFLSNSSYTLIGHNAKFDYEMIKGHYGIDLDNWKDTMLAEQLLNQGKSKVRFNLDAVLEKYLNINLNKSIQLSFADHVFGKEFTEEQIEYAAQDVEYLIQLYDKLLSLLTERGMQSLATLEFKTLCATGDLEYNGIFINKKEWLALQSLAEVEAETIRVKLDTHFEPFCDKNLFGNLSINYNSPKQIIPILEKICKMKITSTADAVLSQHEEDYPVIKDLLEYRQAIKKISTYGEKFVNDNVHPSTHRIHSDFIQLGADSGRYASRNPNMNNIPKQQAYRTPFQAQHSDYRIISADFSQQELRLLAQLSKESKFLEALEKNLDLHCFTGSFIYNIPYESFFLPDGKIDPVMNKKYRGPVKSINFGIIYGMGPSKLARQLGIELKESKELLGKYFKLFPSIKTLIDGLAENAKKNKYALSPLDGRRRDLSDFDWDNPKAAGHAMNIAKNLPFQGGGASTTKLSLVRIRKQIKENKLDARLVNVIHDEILVEVHKNCAEEVKDIVEKQMQASFNYYAPAVPMTVNAEIGKHWIH